MQNKMYLAKVQLSDTCSFIFSPAPIPLLCTIRVYRCHRGDLPCLGEESQKKECHMTRHLIKMYGPKGHNKTTPLIFIANHKVYVFYVFAV